MKVICPTNVNTWLRNVVLFTVLVIFNLNAFPQNPELEYHRLKFYLHPDLAAGLTIEDLKDRISKYAQDLNTIFSKQTNRRFEFSPGEDIILTEEQPHTGNFYGTPCQLPRKNYEIWIHAQLTDNPIYGTYGGHASLDSSGAGVAAGLRWDAVHDRNALADGSEQLEQYWRQIYIIAHETEHAFGAGLSEYYSLIKVEDSTGIEPIQNIGLFQPDDPYWLEHQDYIGDPLLINIWDQDIAGNPTSYTDLMNAVHFASLTVAVLNDTLRWCWNDYLPNLSHTRVHVVEEVTGMPLHDVSVKIWNVSSFPPYSYEMIVDSATDSTGVLQFHWDGGYNTFEHLLLIKVYPEGYQPSTCWFSIFDAQEERMVDGKEELDIVVLSTPLATDVEASEDIPWDFVLSQNFPNPFNSSTTIEYSLPSPTYVELKLHNILGQEIMTMERGMRPGGNHRVLLNSNGLSSGVYFYQIKTGEFIETKKLVLSK